eukprot:CAMPEP_0184874294 /NCGR_PEP_ID=MMETSP0580-20130426/42314_1 /TAXON_ID=1118495 /ORGANISM="Dactyliosolen fragilissimus" /LENGTH=924 /DNA_ID=CAMNT_0027377289 /DNA_START=4362 /DNA_END=7136 /DNA_ORIENTATION=+
MDYLKFTKLNRHSSRKTSIKELLTSSEKVTTISHINAQCSLIEIYLSTLSNDSIDKEYINFVDIILGQINNLIEESLIVSEGTSTFHTENHLDWIREITNFLLIVGDSFGNFANLEYVDMSSKCYNCALRLSKPLLLNFIFPKTSEKIFWSEEFVLNDSKVIQGIIDSFHQMHHHNFRPTICEVGLRIAKWLKETTTDKDQSKTLMKAICNEVFASPLCRAQAFYELGMESLQICRTSGELQNLWGDYSLNSMNCDINDVKSDNSFIDPSPSLQESRKLFTEAVRFSGPASSFLSRKSIRCLALLKGPESPRCKLGMSSGELVHASIGSSARQTVARAYNSDNNEDQSDIESAFRSFDLPFDEDGVREKSILSMYNYASSLIPKSWKFIAMCLCPSGEFLISLLEQSEDQVDRRPFSSKTVCIFPYDHKPGSQYTDSFFYNNILKNFNQIMSENQSQLSGIDAHVADKKYNIDPSVKSSWWEQRQMLDDKLKNLLEHFDNQYFKQHSVEKLLKDLVNIECNSSKFESNECCETTFQGGNLASRFEAACAIENHSQNKTNKKNLEAMTVKQLQKELKEKHGCLPKEIRNLRKADLVDLILSKHDQGKAKNEANRDSDSPTFPISTRDYSDGTESVASQNNASPSKEKKNLDSCLFLILDEFLYQFPFEGIDSLSNISVSRIPSLPFAIAPLARDESSGASTLTINQIGTSYVLDPESNLPHTKHKLQPTLERLSERSNLSWKSTVGNPPSENFMVSALRKPEGLFIYCGHGGGERFFSRAQVENLMLGETPDEDLPRPSHISGPFQCKSSLILMGCSSGRLSSINSSKDNLLDNSLKFYEPEGISLSYLSAGAPCVVCNLWDVTDRDIDRYFLALIENFFGTDNGGRVNESVDLSKCVSDSRKACKMKYIVGCAPVVYGVPVYLK